MALAFNCTITKLAKIGKVLEDYSYKDNIIPEEVSKFYSSCMRETRFPGVSVSAASNVLVITVFIETAEAIYNQ